MTGAPVVEPASVDAMRQRAPPCPASTNPAAPLEPVTTVAVGCGVWRCHERLAKRLPAVDRVGYRRHHHRGPGFLSRPALADVRLFKLARASETRNTCPYCSVACGVILYGLGDRSKNARTDIIHVEGDPDHPVNRGHALPEGREPPRLHPQPHPAQVPRVPRARLDGVEARHLGLGAGPHRAPDEGGPRPELRRQERQGPDGQPLDHDRLPGRVGLHQRDRLRLPQGASGRSGGSPSTTRHVFDTAPRWPVWPRHSAAAR